MKKITPLSLVLIFVFQSVSGMQIFVKTPNGENFPLEVENSSTVAQVKHEIEHHKGFPIAEQRLIYAK